MTATIEPRAEWKQIFDEAWRIERDFFYDPNMHGLNWKGVHDQYAKMLEDANSREDVSFIISEMISELNVGHAYYGGGDTSPQPSVPVGMLGADYELVNGAYRISRIYRGGPWDTDAIGPLSQPGIKVKAGDYILEVNGVPVDTKKDIYAAFIGLADKVVTLTVSSKPKLDGDAREVVVRPLSDEGDLRYRAWIEQNRAYVDKVSGGKVGYIYVPDTGINGQNNLVRQFLGNMNKEALIVDERWNGGGQIPTRFIEMLNRPITNYWARRDGKDWAWPPDAHSGPKCMLINGLSGSGGDAFPWYFRQAKLGKLIGTRTWGGLVGISGNPDLIDGAVVTAPTFAFYKANGTWAVEGHGVDADIEVLDDPALMQNGADPQLDAAIKLMLEEIKRSPYVPAKRPPYPDRRGIGIPEKDR
jgi:tricorn protease